MNNTHNNESSSRKPIKTLTPDQQVSLIGFMKNLTSTIADNGIGYRNFCMILLMLDAGLRVSEVCGLQRSDLWFGEGPVVDLIVPASIAKNGVERTVPLSDRLREAIRCLRKNHWDTLEVHPEFPAFWGQDPQDHLTTRQVQRIVKQITTAALGLAFNPHALRHTFATKMMHLTDIRTVQMLLGHASLSSTQVYTHPSLSDLREAINKTNGPPAAAHVK
jgi:site-specific recombinase XerD